MLKIILDTNFLMLPFSHKIDIFSQIDKIVLEPYKLLVLDRTLDELNKIIKEQRGKFKNAAKMALSLIERKKLEILTTKKQKSLKRDTNSKENEVDDILLCVSDKDTIIATQDKLLKKRLSEKGIKTMILRGEKLVEINVL